jgi:5-methylcytosine-specific restriction protein B
MIQPQMGLRDLTSRDAVLDAIAEYDQLGQRAFLDKYGFSQSREYLLRHDGREYDSKAIVGVAHGLQNPELGPLESAEFNGGEPVISKLASLGFTVNSEGATLDKGVAAWVVRAGREGESEAESLADGFIAIGWGELPSLSEIKSAEGTAELLREHYPERSNHTIGQQKNFVYDFAHTIQQGDLALVPLRTNPRHVAVGRVIGDYQFRETAPFESRHVREVEWLSEGIPADQFGSFKRYINLTGTVRQIPAENAVPAILNMLDTGVALPTPADGLAGFSALVEEVLAELQSPEPDRARIRAVVDKGGEGANALQPHLKDEWTISGGSGQGTVADVPWIGIYPAGGETSAQSGIYAVFLFAADGSAVFLSLNQGTENVKGGLKPLTKRARDIRAAAGLSDADAGEISLGSTADRPRKYEAASAFALRWEAGAVPSGEELASSLELVLGYLSAVMDSGLAFDPVFEPLHLVLKWDPEFEPMTIQRHEEVADSSGSVWWGRFGEGEGQLSKRMKTVQAQLAHGLPTYVFLYGGSQVVRCQLHEITTDPEAVDDRRPDYYPKDKCNLFVRISNFDAHDREWLGSRVLVASKPSPEHVAGALANRSNPLYVYELATPSAQPAVTDSTAPDLDWLAAQTLWPVPELEELIAALETRGQVILAGPPGTGKTWMAKRIAEYLTENAPLRSEIVQFHPSYGYEDFVEGLRPVIEDDVLTFKLVPGRVRKLVTAMAGSEATHALIIDELNRANIPRVFGELMYLLEYRDEPINLQHSNDFELPANLKVIATMNTADRSVRSIDVALRRRFEIFECPADPGVLSRYYDGDGRSTEVPSLVDGFTALNEKLTDHLDRHHTIGQSFFMASSYDAVSLRRAWERQIKPLIEDYFFDQEDLVEDFTLDAFWPNL